MFQPVSRDAEALRSGARPALSRHTLRSEDSASRLTVGRLAFEAVLKSSQDRLGQTQGTGKINQGLQALPGRVG